MRSCKSEPFFRMIIWRMALIFCPLVMGCTGATVIRTPNGTMVATSGDGGSFPTVTDSQDDGTLTGYSVGRVGTTRNSTRQAFVRPGRIQVGAPGTADYVLIEGVDHSDQTEKFMRQVARMARILEAGKVGREFLREGADVSRAAIGR